MRCLMEYTLTTQLVVLPRPQQATASCISRYCCMSMHGAATQNVCKVQTAQANPQWQNSQQPAFSLLSALPTQTLVHAQHNRPQPQLKTYVQAGGTAGLLLEANAATCMSMKQQLQEAPKTRVGRTRKHTPMVQKNAETASAAVARASCRVCRPSKCAGGTLSCLMPQARHTQPDKNTLQKW